MAKLYRKENNCLNCGDDVDGKFCSKCGQENTEIKEPFWAFVSHGIGHYFHYDSKFKKTLRPFLTKPGQLTIDYINGRRARHIPPISLYLFITLVYFLCSPLLKEKGENKSDTNYNNRAVDGKGVVTDFNSIRKQIRYNQLAEYDSQLKMAGKDTSDKVRSSLKKQMRDLTVATKDTTVEAYQKRMKMLPEIERDVWLEQFWTMKKLRYKEETGNNLDVSDAIDKYFPKLLFILMPLFAFFLMLTLRRNKRLYMEHLIYTIHLFSFAFLSLLISEFLIFLSSEIMGTIIEMTAFGVLVWYTYRSIRVVYERSRWATVRKLFSVSVLFLLAFLVTYLFGIASVVLLS